MFSGSKSTLCAPEIVVVGHRCTYEGRKPETDKFGAIMRWGPCQNVGDVRSFLGTCGTCRMFIKNYSFLAGAIQDLLKKDAEFVWGPEQERSMADLKDA